MYINDILPRTVPANWNAPSPTPTPSSQSSTSNPTSISSSAPTSSPSMLTSSGTTNTADTAPFVPSSDNPSPHVSAIVIIVPVIIGILIILGLGWCIFRNQKNPGSWRRNRLENEALERQNEVELERAGSRGSVRSLESFDDVEAAKEEIRRTEIMREGGEVQTGTAKKLQLPPLVAGPFSGRGLPAGGRL